MNIAQDIQGVIARIFDAFATFALMINILAYLTDAACDWVGFGKLQNQQIYDAAIGATKYILIYSNICW